MPRRVITPSWDHNFTSRAGGVQSRNSVPKTLVRVTTMLGEPSPRVSPSSSARQVEEFRRSEDRRGASFPMKQSDSRCRRRASWRKDRSGKAAPPSKFLRSIVIVRAAPANGGCAARTGDPRSGALRPDGVRLFLCHPSLWLPGRATSNSAPTSRTPSCHKREAN